MGKTSYVPFRIRRTYDNPARQRPNLFRILFDRGIPEGEGHEINLQYEAPDENAREHLNRHVNAGSQGARPRIKVIWNAKDGWKIAEPLDIQENSP